MLLTNERTKNQPRTMFFEIEDRPLAYKPSKKELKREKELINAYKDYKKKRLHILNTYVETPESSVMITELVRSYNKHVKELNNKYRKE